MSDLYLYIRWGSLPYTDCPSHASATVQVAQVLDDGGALVSYGGMSLRPIKLSASLLQVRDNASKRR